MIYNAQRPLIGASFRPGRTGRFGRKGISINFVHDKNTWNQMETIEKATGKSITRIETTDLDVMEEVRTTPRFRAFYCS